MSNQKMTLDKAQFDTFVELISKGMANATSGLSQMVGSKVEATGLKARLIPVKDAATTIGGPEASTVGVYLAVKGSADGHALLVYQPQTALELVDILMEAPPGSTNALGAMEQSVLGEVGNVMGSFFLNTLADATGLDLRVSPPAVMEDMAGAILDAVLAEIMCQTDMALIVETTFCLKDRCVGGTFLILPTPELQEALLKRWNAA